MERRKQRNVLIVLNMLILVVLGISSFYHFIVYHDFTYKKGTIVGPIYIGGMNGNSLLDDLDIYVTEWKNESAISFVYQDKISIIDRTQISFDLNRTVDSIKNGSENRLYSKINMEYVSYYISDNYSEIQNNIDIDRIEIDLEKQIGLLNKNIVIDLEDYIVNSEQLVTDINTITISNVDSELYNLLESKLENKSIEIKGDSYFSLNDYLSDTELNNQSLSIIATGIFELILTTNFNDIDKNNNDSLPVYADEGMDVLIDENNDLTFYNPNKHSYQINIVVIDNTIQFTLIGIPFICDYEVEIEKTVIQKDTIYRNDDSLPSGQIIEEGQDGMKIKLYRLIKQQDGKIIKMWVSDDIYLPINKVVVKSS